MPDLRRFPKTIPLLLLVAAARAVPAPVITPENIAAHVNVLASDAFEGRAPGTAGEEKTVAYITDAFRAAGLAPLDGGDWRMPVPLVTAVAASGEIRSGGTLLANGDASLVRAAPTETRADLTGEAVFVGFGISAAAEGRDDFARINLAGKIAVLLDGLPIGMDGAEPAIAEQRGRAAKVRNAERAGAAAVVVIYDAATTDAAWQAVHDAFAREQTRLDDGRQTTGATLTAVMDCSAGQSLATALNTDLAALKAEANLPEFLPKSLGTLTLSAQNRLRRFTSSNVAGVLRGVRYPDEYVAYIAHWDHLGHCASGADTICNGAIDNASGVGGLIELAKAFEHGKRPQRSILLLASTAEERGLLGGRYFAASGPIAPTRFVAAFGLDTIAANGPTSDVIILGQGYSSLDDWIARAAKAQGRKIVDMPAVQGFFRRSDHFAFAEVGVPTVIATGVFAEGGGTEAYLHDRYHKPSDESSAAIDYRGAAQDVELLLAAGRAIANSRKWPAWGKSSPYQRNR